MDRYLCELQYDRIREEFGLKGSMEEVVEEFQKYIDRKFWGRDRYKI